VERFPWSPCSSSSTSLPRQDVGAGTFTKSWLGGKVLTSWRVIPTVKPVQDVSNEATKLFVDLVGLDAAIVVAGHRAVPKS
jgi:hypothetical protein